MTRIGKNYILKCILNDGYVVYWARSKNYKFVMDPSNATFFKTKKEADNKAKTNGREIKKNRKPIITNEPNYNNIYAR